MAGQRRKYPKKWQLSENVTRYCVLRIFRRLLQGDTHFEIEKHQKGTETITEIHPLEGDDSVRELARLLGGAELTQAVFENAKEMKELARVHKNTRLK